MRLALTLPQTEFVLQESIPLHLCFTNGDAPTAFPYEYNALNLLTLRLFDADGTLLAEANGYTRDLRLGFDLVPEDPASLMTASLPPGQEVEWDEDVLDYFDLLEPGAYAVQALFAFPPASIVAETDRVAFQITPIACHHLDVLTDTVAMQVLHVLQQHHDADTPRTLFQFRSVHAPQTQWSGASFPTPGSARAQISEADFATMASFEHDFFRWLAWLSEDMLTLATVRNGEAGTPHTHTLPLSHSRLIGRPLQHEDESVSVLIMGRDAAHAESLGGWQLCRIDIDAEGHLAQTRSLGTLPEDHPAPCSSGCDGAGATYVLTGDDSGLPLRLHRLSDQPEIATQTLLTQADWDAHFADHADAGGTNRLLCTRLLLKPGLPTEPPCALALGLFESSSQRLIWIGQHPLDAAAEPEWRFAAWAIETMGFAARETIEATDVHCRAQDQLHSVLLTSQGRIIHLESHREPAVIASSPTIITDQARLVTASGGLYLFCADSQVGAMPVQLG